MELLSSIPLIAYIVGVALLMILFVVRLSKKYREVVPTNMVQIVQRKKTTTSYGKDQPEGNVYFRWPSWWPFIGVEVIELPVSNFEVKLDDYEAYDKDRVPFRVDVVAFYRIVDTAKAAQRVTDVGMLKDQLKMIVQGAVRKVLAGDVIDAIMLERSKFGEEFSSEVKNELDEWGVQSVKSMELMDIRDGKEGDVITNIMAKKTSQIEMESRTEVANNKKKAEIAEVDAHRDVDVRKQEALQIVGERTALTTQTVGIANQKSEQHILVEQKTTREKSMEVKRVEQVKQAEITRDQQVVAADQDRQTKIIVAEGVLEAKKKEAEGVEVLGLANAEAEKAMQLAPVQAQITLAKEIGENAGYQTYLMTIEAIKTYLVVGSEQAKALQGADVKVISNTGEAGVGLKGVMDIFSSKGGTNLAAMLEALSQSPLGEALLGKLTVAKKIVEAADVQSASTEPKVEDKKKKS